MKTKQYLLIMIFMHNSFLLYANAELTEALNRFEAISLITRNRLTCSCWCMNKPSLIDLLEEKAKFDVKKQFALSENVLNHSPTIKKILLKELSSKKPLRASDINCV